MIESLKEKKGVIVISLGGSVLVSGGKPDYIFLHRLKKFLKKISRKHKIIIVTGGGSTARNYIETLRKEKLPEGFQDIIGIEATRLNAKLLLLFLNLKQKIPETLGKIYKLAKKQTITVAGGINPGTTTDGVAAIIAAKLNTCCIINITNVNGLYTKDPNKYKGARLIKQINYSKLFKKLEKIHEKPGQHFILDKLATKIITRKRIKTVILGKNIANLENFLQGKKFTGTIISD